MAVNINGIIFYSDAGAVADIAKAENKTVEEVQADYDAVKSDTCNCTLYGKYCITDCELEYVDEVCSTVRVVYNTAETTTSTVTPIR